MLSLGTRRRQGLLVSPFWLQWFTPQETPLERDDTLGRGTTQLLMPESRQEIIFQAAHGSPMVGLVGHENLWIDSWPDFMECQLVNQSLIPKNLLHLLPLMKVTFERIGMDLIGPLGLSTLGLY